MDDTALLTLAREAGLLVEWQDAAGHGRVVAPDTLRAVLAALGFPAASNGELRDSQEKLRSERDRPPALATARAGERISVGSAPRAQFLFEDGSRADAEVIFDGGQSFVLAPGRPGYHAIECDGALHNVAIAPRRAFTPEDIAARKFSGPKFSGIGIQLYALKGASDCGFGDFAALASFADGAAKAGIDALAISPVHALLDGAYAPYMPSSRFFLNPLYADAAPFACCREPVGDAPLIDWPKASVRKMQVLRDAFAAFESAPQDDFRTFVEDGGVRLRDHARFEALAAHFAAQGMPSFHHWPQEFRSASDPTVERFASGNARTVAFHLFAQWLAARSFAGVQGRAKALGMAIGIIADIAVGMSPDGSHAWSAPDDLIAGLSVGAPPDLFNADGQNWAITALSPAALRRSGFDAFIATVRANLKPAGGVRTDHAMGLRRLWVVPRGASAKEGVYVRYPERDLFNLVALESVRHRAIVIGEDLGTVPAGFRETMNDAGLLGMRVLWFEREGARFTDPATWDRRAVAMTTTHDLPTVAGWWSGNDIAWQKRLGRFASLREEQEAESARAQDRERLREAIGAQAGDDIVADTIAHVGRAACELAIVPVEDILALEEQPNIPGTVDEHPNWRRRPPRDVFSSPEAMARLKRLRDARNAS